MGGVDSDRSLTVSLPEIGLLDFIPVFVRGDRFDLLIFIQSAKVVNRTNKKTTRCENALFFVARFLVGLLVLLVGLPKIQQFQELGGVGL